MRTENRYETVGKPILSHVAKILREDGSNLACVQADALLRYAVIRCALSPHDISGALGGEVLGRMRKWRSNQETSDLNAADILAAGEAFLKLREEENSGSQRA